MAVHQQLAKRKLDDDRTVNGPRGYPASATGKRGQSSRCPSGVRVPLPVSRECFYVRRGIKADERERIELHCPRSDKGRRSF